METLFTRAGTEQKPNGQTEKGAPVYRHAQNCSRCGGLGFAEKWRHTGLTCYRCGGGGRDPNLATEKLYTAEKLAKLVAAQEKRDAAKAIARAEAAAIEKARKERERDQIEADHKDLIDRLVRLAGDKIADEGFFKSIHDQVMVQARALSENQIAAVTRSLDKIEAEKARRNAASHVGIIGERREFTLTLLRINTFGDQWAPGGLTYICTFRDENGCTVVYKGNSPHSLGLVSVYNAELRYSETTIGQTIRVSAKVKKHDSYRDEPQTYISHPKALESVA